MDRTKTILTQKYPDSIRKDIDPDLLAYFILSIQVGVYDYLAIKFDDDLLKNIEQGKPLYSLHKSEFENIIKSLTKLIETGISRKTK